MNELSLLSWIDAVFLMNQQTSQRSVIVLSGDFSFCCKTLELFINALPYTSVMRVSSSLDQAVPSTKARMLLGRECDVLVFDAYCEFDIDAFGAVSGTVKAGGMLFLLMPGEENADSYVNRSRFFSRAWSFFNDHENVYILKENNELPAIKKRINIVDILPQVAPPYRTQEQQNVVQAIVNSVVEKNRLAIVLTSDRGRGKSSALGIASGTLLLQGINKIIVTAPRIKNIEPVFYHAKNICGGIGQGNNRLLLGDASLDFMAPDALLEKQPVADVILVDEASALPLPLLEKMLEVFPKIIFTATIHGYEGTGRGFALKFNKILNARMPGWQKYELATPVRWIQNDPVEKWIAKMLCLNTELACVEEISPVDINECNVECIDRDALLKSDERLSSLFALLVYAHYRTQPSDLAYMLDSDSIRLYTLERNHKILAAVLVSIEGGFDKQLSMEIYKGMRRPQGHLLAQTLSFHAGVEAAATLTYARIMRVAVHPELQRQGLGTHLLRQVMDREQAAGIAAIGSSFGGTVELLRFWKNLGFDMVRMGFTRDHASGTHSAVVLKVLNEKAEEVFIESRSKFRSYVKDWLSGPLADVSPDMQAYLQNDYVETGVELTDYEWRDIKSFVYSHRGYEACMTPLKKLVNRYESLIGALDEPYQIIMCAKIKNMKSWPEVVKETGVTGKSQAVECLKLAVKSLLESINSVQ